MKILNITKYFEDSVFGGVETFIDEICIGLKSHGIYSDVYTIKKKKVKHRPYKIYHDDLKFSLFSCPVSFNSIKNFLKISHNYDVFNFHYPWPFMDLLSFFVPKEKIIITYHSDITKKNIFYYLYLPLMLVFLFRSKKIIVTSKNYLNSSKVLSYFKNKVEIIPIGITENIAKIKKTKNNFNNLLKKNYFLFLGNLRDYKGLEFLITAFKKIKCNLVIIGDGKNKEIIKKKIQKIKNIFLLDKIEDNEKKLFLKNTICLILPSIDRREAFGIALLEAFASKKPVISTEVGSATSFVNINLKTGLVIKPKNVKEIEKSCNMMLLDKKRRDKMGINAYNRYKEYFTSKLMIKNYISLLKNF